MSMSIEILALLMFAASLVLSAGLTPIVRRLAMRWGAVDYPGERKVHTEPTARMGGAAIFIGWLLPLLVVVSFRQAHWAKFFGAGHVATAVIATATMMFALGVYDDFRGASARLKLPVQILAAVILYLVGIRIENVSNPFDSTLALGVFALPATVLWIVGLTNAVNLLDGIDGLAAGVSTLTAIVMGLAAHYDGSTETQGILYVVPVAGAALGFLLYNFPPASIFMGDCGSLFLGFILATVSLLSSQKGHASVAVFVPLIVFGVPVTDTALAMLRRYLTGRNLFEADRRHVHHILLERGVSPRHTLLILYGASAILGGAALLLMNASGRAAPFIVVAVVGGVLLACSRLGYYEFQHLREFVRHGPKRRDEVVFRRRLVLSVGQCILEEHSFDRMWCLIREVANILSFDRASFVPSSDGRVADTPGHEGDGSPSKELPDDFRERVWTRPAISKDDPLTSRLVVPVQADDRSYGELILERAHAQREDLEERAVLNELCAYLADGMSTLEAEIGRRGTGRGDG